MNTLPVMILLFVGVMGFAGNLFYRVIILYVKYREREPINWWWEMVVIFGVPLTIMLAIVEIMYVLGWFAPGDNHRY